MEKLDLKEVPKLKPNPLFKGLPSKLKDPKNFLKIEKQLEALLKTNHKHKTMSAYAKCEQCQVQRMTRQRQMKDIGFKSINQYMEWRKIMTIIRNKSNFQVR